MFCLRIFVYTEVLFFATDGEALASVKYLQTILITTDAVIKVEMNVDSVMRV